MPTTALQSEIDMDRKRSLYREKARSRRMQWMDSPSAKSRSFDYGSIGAPLPAVMDSADDSSDTNDIDEGGNSLNEPKLTDLSKQGLASRILNREKKDKSPSDEKGNEPRSGKNGAAPAVAGKRMIKDRLKKFAAERAKNAARRAVGNHSDGPMFALLFAAISVDLLPLLDVGTVTTIANWVAGGIALVVLLMKYLFRDPKDKFDFFNIIKRKLWQRICLVLPEGVPGVGLFPLWTIAVLSLWYAIKEEMRSLLSQEEKDKERSLKKAKMQLAFARQQEENI